MPFDALSSPCLYGGPLASDGLELLCEVLHDMPGNEPFRSDSIVVESSVLRVFIEMERKGL